jgi:hypothetical protein
MRYQEAHRWALQMKTGGATATELQERARRLDDDGKYGAAKAFRDVAAE